MLATGPPASQRDTTSPLSTSQALSSVPTALKATERGCPSDERAGAIASAPGGSSTSVSETMRLGSATTMPAAMRYLASIGWVHSYTSRVQPWFQLASHSVAERA